MYVIAFITFRRAFCARDELRFIVGNLPLFSKMPSFSSLEGFAYFIRPHLFTFVFVEKNRLWVSTRLLWGCLFWGATTSGLLGFPVMDLKRFSLVDTPFFSAANASLSEHLSTCSINQRSFSFTDSFMLVRLLSSSSLWTKLNSSFTSGFSGSPQGSSVFAKFLFSVLQFSTPLTRWMCLQSVLYIRKSGQLQQNVWMHVFWQTYLHFTHSGCNCRTVY